MTYYEEMLFKIERKYMCPWFYDDQLQLQEPIFEWENEIWLRDGIN